MDEMGSLRNHRRNEVGDRKERTDRTKRSHVPFTVHKLHKSYASS